MIGKLRYIPEFDEYPIQPDEIIPKKPFCN